jgi:integrase
MPTANPSATVVVREYDDQPFYEAHFRHFGRQKKRRVGPAWIDRDPSTGKWDLRRKGRVPDGHYDHRAATVRAAAIVAGYVAEADDREHTEQERRARGATFREITRAYLKWLKDVRGAKPATLVGHRSVLIEPGIPYKRGKKTTAGPVMAALGDRPATAITTREIEDLLQQISDGGASSRTVNKYRAVINAVYNYARKPSTFALEENPASAVDRRREPEPEPLVFYTPDDIEMIAVALELGLHREPTTVELSEREREEQRAEDYQDAAIIRVAAYTGLRQGELLALRWRDVSFANSVLIVVHAMSAKEECSTKSGKPRWVPMADQAATTLEDICGRRDFTSPSDRVFSNALGSALDESALRRRYKRAQAAAGVRPLRFHDLRHTFGSLLAMRGVDLVTIKEAMGHSKLSTTSRYLHARPATDQARVFTLAFNPAPPVDDQAAGNHQEPPEALAA